MAGSLNISQVLTIIKQNVDVHLALVRETFVLWLSARNPTAPLPLDLTVDSMITSSSWPWKPSMDFILTRKPSHVSYFLPSLRLISSTCELYGETTPMLSPWPDIFQAAGKSRTGMLTYLYRSIFAQD